MLMDPVGAGANHNFLWNEVGRSDSVLHVVHGSRVPGLVLCGHRDAEAVGQPSRHSELAGSWH